MTTMTQTEHLGHTAYSGPSGRPAARARLISGRLALVLLSSFGALTSFYLLLSVTPMYAMSAGAGSAEAGVVTGSLMLATVLAEFASARLMRRYGYRAVFAAGALLLGGPALALPSGVWLAGNAGYAVVIAITAASALAPLAAIPWLAIPADHQAEPDPGTGQPAGLLASLRSGGQLRPSLVFAATTVSAGVVAAFLPLAPGVSGSVAAAGLFTQAVASTVTRWWAGRHGDRHGHARLLVPGLLTAAAGMTILIWVAAPAALIAGMCLFGTGFGITQNATFALLIDRAPASGYGTASALWNLAYDAGYGAGPAVFGMFAGSTGYPAAFALTGTLMLAALVPAIRDRGVPVKARGR